MSMENILRILADEARERVEADMRKIPFADMKQQAEESANRVRGCVNSATISSINTPVNATANTPANCASNTPVNAIVNTPETLPFYKALSKPGLSFITEVKKASPSKGIIAEDFDYLQIALEYEAAGADAISVLTEPKRFLGADGYLDEISGKTQLPCLRKDFVVSPYQIYQAKTLGAAAVLLIVSILSADAISEYIKIADSIALNTLIECHDETEIETAIGAGAKIIGVNNRDLKTFNVDTKTASALRELVPKDILFVSESGIRTDDDIRAAVNIKADAVLVGETLMRAQNKQTLLKRWREISNQV
jgi:indole-3-glycerol phosphate synthase